MKMYFYGALVGAICLSQPAAAQQTLNTLTLVSWNTTPKIHQPDERYKNEAAVILADTRRIEYIDQDQKLAEYRTVHKIVHINDDNGIEAFNRVYLDVYDNADIRDIKARTILPNGKIIEVDKKNIRDIQENDRSYKIFAMEGVEKGCEVEYYYTYKVSFNYFGREVLQSHYPVVSSSVEIIAPERLIFDARAFNTGKNISDTTNAGKRIVSLHQQNINAAEDEKYAAYTAMLNRIEYKLSYNTSRSSEVRLFTWNELAKLAHAAYSTFTSGEQKKVADLVKKQGWEKLNSDEEKVVQVEKFIKTYFSNRDDIRGEAAEDLENVIKNKIAGDKGIIRLYSAVFNKLGVAHEYVLCGSRETYELDKNFENWDNADNVMFYFTSTKKFICPTQVEMRYPWINPLWTSTTALFCKPTVIGNFSTALGVIKTLAADDYELSQNNIDADIAFNPNVDTLLMSVTNAYSGYSSVYMRAAYNFRSKEDREAMVKDMVKSNTGSEHIVSTAFRNESLDHLTKNEPFLFDASVKSVELIEKAGNKILVKIGEIIGQQAEIYEAKPRQMPIHIDYPHVMKRKITFKIPEGYAVLNPEVFNINSVFTDNGERTMGFESSYKIENGVLTINVVEDYRKVSYPLVQYTPFQKIINAAADFNKAVLVIQKK